MSSAEFRVQSEIADDLQEIQQEQEIIFIDESWQRHQMTFAMDNDDDGSQSGSRPTAHAPQHATTILNKSFIHDKTVDMTANFHQDEEDDEKQFKPPAVNDTFQMLDVNDDAPVQQKHLVSESDETGSDEAANEIGKVLSDSGAEF